MFSTKSQAAFDQFKAKYPPGHDYTTPGATEVDLISDLRQLARDVDVDIPADRIRLFYSDFRDQLKITVTATVLIYVTTFVCFGHGIVLLFCTFGLGL